MENTENKTGAQRYFDERMKDPVYAEAFALSKRDLLVSLGVLDEEYPYNED